MNYLRSILTIFVILILSFISITSAEDIDSQNYKIIDAQIGGSEVTSSQNYSLLAGFNPNSESKLESSSYRFSSGSASSFIANVPTITCLETNTTQATTLCNDFPHANGAIGECGFGGCYDRAKIEINRQNNPLDTLYLVQVLDVTNSQIYYLQSDFTIASNYDISDFMDICSIHGKDNFLSTCDDSSDVRWNENNQKYNIRSLKPNTQYSISVSAMHGNLTGTEFGPAEIIYTQIPKIALDVDTADSLTPEYENSNPYSINLGVLGAGVNTANELILIDFDTNIVQGASVFVKSQNGGLMNSNSTEIIPSENEDLDIDVNQNGGYGIKINSYSSPNSTLGPINFSSSYNTISAKEVGSISTSNSLLAFTNNSGNNVGQILGGRFGVEIHAKSTIDYSTGNYSDNISFFLISN